MRYDDLVGAESAEPLRPSSPTSTQEQWLTDGVVVLPKFLPDDLIDAYRETYEFLGLRRTPWTDATPYMRIPEMRRLCTYAPLAQVLEEVVGEPAGVHLTLISWVSTERNWHQDHYLNPPHVGSWYAAAWMALEDIDPNSGPFEYVPGSHRWPVLDRRKVLDAIGADAEADPSWPKRSEEVLTQAFEDKIAETRAEVRQFLAKRGDVLLWHARTVHRGSVPKKPGTPRRALIAHYSGINHRHDMPPARGEGGGLYFPIGSAFVK